MPEHDLNAIEGEEPMDLEIAVLVDKEDVAERKIVGVRFEKTDGWFILSPDRARELAQFMLKCADVAEGKVEP